MKRKFVVLLMTAVMLLVFGGMAEAMVANKQIQVNYNNVKIYTNGKMISLPVGQEPFLLNGVTYVPLRVAGEALNSTVNWEAETKTIYITDGTAKANSDLAAQLAQKNKEIADLKIQVADLQAKLDDDLSDLEDNLLDDFDELEDVDIDDIKLDGDEDEVEVEVEVDLDDYEDEWADLTDSDIEDWLDDLVDYIQDELTNDTVVEGVIYSTDDDELVEFTKDGDDSLEVDFNDDDFRDAASGVEDSLMDETFEVDDLEFTVFYINYDDDKVKVKFEAEDSDCAAEWEELSSDTIEDAEENIGEDIADEFEDEDVDVETVKLYFYDEDDNFIDSYYYEN